MLSVVEGKHKEFIIRKVCIHSQGDTSNLDVVITVKGEKMNGTLRIKHAG